MKRFSLGLLVASPFVALNVQAAIITLNSSLPGAYLGSDGVTAVYPASFNGTSQLPAHFIVNSASYLFRFTDDGFDESSYSALRYDGQQTGGYGATGPATYSRLVTNFYSQVQTLAGESAALSFGQAHLATASGSTSSSHSALFSARFDGTFLDHTVTTPDSYYYYPCGAFTCLGVTPGYTSYYYTTQQTFTDTTW